MSAEDVLRNAARMNSDPELRAMAEKAKRMDTPEPVSETIYHRNTSSVQLQPAFPGSNIMMTILSFITPDGKLMHFPLPQETWDSLVRAEMEARAYFERMHGGAAVDDARRKVDDEPTVP